jgi:DNA-binding NtrC family response regulator
LTVSTLAPSEANRLDPSFPRELVLVVVAGPARGQRVRLLDQTRVGARADADVQLPTEDARVYAVKHLPGRLLVESEADGRLVADIPNDGATLGTLGVVELGATTAYVRAELDQGKVAPLEAPRFADCVGPSVAMRAVFGVLKRVAPTDARLLIEGEPGTGKATLARAVHATSERRERPLIVVDCGATSYDVIGTELFGGEAYASNGSARAGAIEAARGNTLLLAEVDELPLPLQPRLRDVLERLGSEVRVIATTKRNLYLEVEKGKFDQELLMELAAVPVSIPPLRSRREDVPALVEHFVAQGRKLGADVADLPAEAIAGFSLHDWPGNVHELAAVVSRFVDSGSDAVVPLPLPSAQPESDPVPGFDPSSTYRETRGLFEANFERRYIRWLLLRHRGNISAAAREAKMDRKHLYDLARKHGLRGERPSSVPPSSRG